MRAPFLAPLVLAATSASAQHFDLRTDFDLNTNPGERWSYRWGGAPLRVQLPGLNQWIGPGWGFFASYDASFSSSGGNASSSSSASSGGGGGDSATYVTVPACYDSSDVVGYRRCSSYGSRWAIPEHLPALALELTSWTARIDLADVEAGGTVHHSFGDDYNYRVVGSDLGGSALANGLKLRLVGHHRGLSLGVRRVPSRTWAPTAAPRRWRPATASPR